METSQSDQFLEENASPANPMIMTISAIALDFDFVTSDPSKSRADEIKLLLVRNKKPPRNSKEGKPGGSGLPTGQLESKEHMLEAVKRETRDESGCSVKKIVAKLFVVHKRLMIDGNTVPNEIHVYLVEASEPLSRIREVDEIDGTVEPWVPLRQVFEMPFAQDKGGGSRNANGIYFSHLRRLYNAIESMVFSPEDLLEGEAAKLWLKPNREALMSAMADLENAGLLKEFLPQDEV
jgi:ADP-ribose pyrophosphatase YjhB (NUDIX family)